MEQYDDLDNLEDLPRIKNMPEVRSPQPWRVRPKIQKKLSQSDILASLKEQNDEACDY